MPPLDKKKRILLIVASIIIPLVMFGSFAWPVLKQFYQSGQNGGSHANLPLFIFGGFFLIFIFGPIISVIRLFRRLDKEGGSPVSVPPPTRNQPGSIFLFLFSLPFAGFGVVALVQGVRKLIAGDLHYGFGLGAFGLIFSAVGFGLMTMVIVTRKKAGQVATIEAAHPHAPWLLRADWAAGYCKSGFDSQKKIMLVIALAFCAIGGSQTFMVLPQELHKGNSAALIILLFPAVGISLLIVVIQAERARRRFGVCTFKPAAIPVPLGTVLQGVIQTGARVKLEQGLHLKLTCLRRLVTGSGKSQHTQEDILWQEEKVLTPSATFPEPETGHSAIPVYFKLPAGQPQCLDGNPAILWRLEAKSKMSGPGFDVTFEVPVFMVAGAKPLAAKVSDESEPADPTAAMQMPEEQVRQVEHSKIKVSNTPGGREFYFPAARNLGSATGLTVFFLIWSGIFYFLLHSGAPLLFPICWGVTDFFVGWACFNLWFKSSRITINATAVTVTNRWLLFARSRRFDASEVARIEVSNGMTSGNQVFSNLQLFTRSDKKVTIAATIPSRAEAQWLAQEMLRTLGRK